MCGTAEWEWEADPYAYVPVAHLCKGCQLREVMQADEDTKGKGISIRLLPKRVADRLAREAETRQRPKRRRRR